MHPIDLTREIRCGALRAIHAAGSGHPGGSLSCADLLAHLWAHELEPEALREGRPGRSRLVLSKGHAAPALYAAAAACGVIEPATLLTLRQLASPLQGHPHVGTTPWVETSTGSLGQGFSVAVGMALGLRHRGIPARVFALLGDGELQEGQVWEAAMSASHYRLGRLTAVVDWNGLQSDDRNERVMGLEPLAERWAAFGWHVLEIDGHDPGAIAGAFRAARAEDARPSVVLARTVKGRGVSFMEDDPAWHGSLRLSDEDLARALAELGAAPAAPPGRARRSPAPLAAPAKEPAHG